jgi:hypothetical protein
VAGDVARFSGKKADYATQVAPTWWQAAEYGRGSKGRYTAEAVNATLRLMASVLDLIGETPLIEVTQFAMKILMQQRA